LRRKVPCLVTIPHLLKFGQREDYSANEPDANPQDSVPVHGGTEAHVAHDGDWDLVEGPDLFFEVRELGFGGMRVGVGFLGERAPD